MTARSEREETVARWLEAAYIPFQRQKQFHPTRKWRFDFALGLPENGPRLITDAPTISECKLAIEVEGGQFTGGHKRGKAADSDYEKFNAASMLWWRVLRFSTGMVERGECWPVILEAWHHYHSSGWMPEGEEWTGDA